MTKVSKIETLGEVRVSVITLRTRSYAWSTLGIRLHVQFENKDFSTLRMSHDYSILLEFPNSQKCDYLS
jgi:hypothetical protein